ncbi:flavodoxin family protein [Methanocella sp. CWC-04]|uniref:Flavodoxin family protein n=1 Tax=Methanooceanicella nereidis TaxID=2052831 RepID=A0AAP2REB6_9EURY|nr:flavodoxin family protein [Methanocella sp. CWC-04]MCD1295221.1 flavodoxin family protein [Methanocella sp. CWC-04]
MYKVIGIVGSPRFNGNTEYLIREALEVLKKEGFDTELIHLGEKKIAPCEACYACNMMKDCQIQDDFQEIFAKMEEADGIILGSPVYFGSATPQIKALIDRAGLIALKKDRALNRKVGAAIAVARRAGANFTFAQMNYFFYINGMIVPGSTYWNVGYAMDMGAVEYDEEAIRTVRNLAENIAWLIKKIKA